LVQESISVICNLYHQKFRAQAAANSPRPCRTRLHPNNRNERGNRSRSRKASVPGFAGTREVAQWSKAAKSQEPLPAPREEGGDARVGPRVLLPVPSSSSNASCLSSWGAGIDAYLGNGIKWEWEKSHAHAWPQSDG
jgi:hypothetical protein